LQRDAELSLIRRLLDHELAHTTQLAPAALTLPASRYASPEHHAAERERLFRGSPLVACLSSDLSEPGSYLGLEAGGVPLLVIRGRDGRVRAFVNACRHRGAPLATGRGRADGGRVRCPFHAWSYALDGSLAAIPVGEAGHAAVDRSRLGLAQRPCAESSGLVLVRAAGDEAIDAPAWLGEVAADLRALGVAGYQFFGSDRSEWRCNWKLLLETFLESLHVFSLHRASVDPWYLSLPMACDALGAHLRFPVAKRSLVALRGEPEHAWSLVDHATLQWFVAPNALLSATRHSALLWRFESPAPNLTRVETSLYSAQPDPSEARAQRLREELELQLRVTAQEDFPMQEAIQRGLDAGAVGPSCIGRHEVGVIHLHESLARLMAGSSPGLP
jgi:nitrite reductase/ring-hydroxylating ferredoxin subunit